RRDGTLLRRSRAITCVLCGYPRLRAAAGEQAVVGAQRVRVERPPPFSTRRNDRAAADAGWRRPAARRDWCAALGIRHRLGCRHRVAVTLARTRGAARESRALATRWREPVCSRSRRALDRVDHAGPLGDLLTVGSDQVIIRSSAAGEGRWVSSTSTETT